MIVTGSQLDRIVRCPSSGALPQVITVEREDDEDSRRGTAIHRFLERVPLVGRDAALTEADEKYRDICAEVELGKLAEQLALSQEVAVAWNWRADTSRLLTPVAPRAYEIDPSCEIAMTPDVVGVGGDRVYIGDYKGPHAWLPEPEVSYQLGAAAVAVARFAGATQARVEYIRIRDDGTPRKFYSDLDVFALEAAAEKIATLLEGLPARRSAIAGGAVPDVSEGRWCRYCPARQHCPAKTALIRRVLHDPQPVPYLQPLTPASALRAYQLLKPARDVLKQVEEALYAYAKYTPIHLGTEEDGSERFFGELSRPGNEELDGAVTHRVLTELYDGEIANKAVELATTKTAITNAIRPAVQAAGQKITHAQERIYEMIRASGGSRHPEARTTTEYTVAPDGAAKARKRKS